MPEDGKYPDRMMTAIREAEEAGRPDRNEQLVLVSYSVPEDGLLKLKDTICTYMFRTSVEVQAIATEMVERQVKHPSRIYADGDIGNITTHLLLNDSLPGWFESPAPRTLHPVSPISHRWIVDITFMQHLIPRHPSLGHIAVNGSNVGDTRELRDRACCMC